MIIACTAIDGIGAIQSFQVVVAIAALDQVIAVAANNSVIAPVAIKGIIAGTAIDFVCTVTAVHFIIAARARNRIAPHAIIGINLEITVERIIPDTALNRVVIRTTEDEIRTSTAVNAIVTASGVNRVVAAIAGNHIITLGHNIAATVAWEIGVTIPEFHEFAGLFTVNGSIRRCGLIKIAHNGCIKLAKPAAAVTYVDIAGGNRRNRLCR